MEDKIKDALKTKPLTNKELRSALGLKVSSYDSKLDRTLQKMRKGGSIRAVNGRWQDASIKICDHCGGVGWTQEK